MDKSLVWMVLIPGAVLTVAVAAFAGLQVAAGMVFAAVMFTAFMGTTTGR